MSPGSEARRCRKAELGFLGLGHPRRENSGGCGCRGRQAGGSGTQEWPGVQKKPGTLGQKRSEEGVINPTPTMTNYLPTPPSKTAIGPLPCPRRIPASPLLPRPRARRGTPGPPCELYPRFPAPSRPAASSRGAGGPPALTSPRPVSPRGGRPASRTARSQEGSALPACLDPKTAGSPCLALLLGSSRVHPASNSHSHYLLQLVLQAVSLTLQLPPSSLSWSRRPLFLSLSFHFLSAFPQIPGFGLRVFLCTSFS